MYKLEYTRMTRKELQNRKEKLVIVPQDSEHAMQVGIVLEDDVENQFCPSILLDSFNYSAALRVFFPRGFLSLTFCPTLGR